MRLKNAWFFIIITLFFANLNGQVTSSSTDYIDTIIYPSRNQEVLVFVFNAPVNGTKLGALTVRGPSDTVDYNFNWEKYDSLSATFNTFYNSNGIISIQNNLNEGGYRIIIDTANNSVDTLHAWIFLNNFDVAILNKNSEGQLDYNSRNCFYFTLDAKSYLDSMVYFDIYNHSRYVLNSTIEDIVWETETEDEEYQGINQESLQITDYTSLVEDTEFTLIVTDKYGAERSDTVEYIPVRVRAKYEDSIKYVTQLSPVEFYKNYYKDSTKLSAPQEVKFFNESSSKVDSIIWRFDDDSVSFYKDTIIHTYYRVGDYSPTLIVYNSEAGCVDSIKKDNLIQIPSAEFEMPNAFSIQAGNVFRCYDVSVTYIEIIIFTRWGQKVHQYAGDIRYWGGWDGRINGSNRYAKTGVYYYVITALDGWESREKRMNFDKKVKTGFFHVFNYDF